MQQLLEQVSTLMAVITDSLFDGNYAMIGGGDFMGNSKSLSRVYNSTFSNNVAVEGGAITTNGNLYFDGSDFENNTAEYGGALQVRNAGRVTNSNFNNNTAGNGVQIYIDSPLSDEDLTAYL